MKRERKDESVTLSLVALAFFVGLVLGTLESLGFENVKVSPFMSELLMGTLFTYLGRKSKWFNADNKLESENEKDVPKSAGPNS